MASRAMRMQDASRRFDTGVATHVGRVRERNEDSYLARPDTGIWAVADGMGGLDAGDFASATVIEALGSIGTPRSAAELLAWCEKRVVAANSTLHELGRRRGSLIGTTIAVLLAHERHFACVWSGDSRIYLVHDGAISLQSRDHTEVQELVSEGKLSPIGGAYLAATKCHYPRDRRAYRSRTGDQGWRAARWRCVRPVQRWTDRACGGR